MDSQEMFGDIVDRLIRAEQDKLQARQKVSELHGVIQKLQAEIADLVARDQEPGDE